MSEDRNLALEDTMLALDNQLCFRLYAASRAIQRLYRPVLDDLGITYPQYLVLLALWQWRLETPERCYTQKDVCERLSLDSGTVAPLIKRMEEAGWVVRQRNKQDARETHIVLTESGLSLKRPAVAVPMSAACKPGMPVNEYPDMVKQLDVLLEALLS